MATEREISRSKPSLALAHFVAENLYVSNMVATIHNASAFQLLNQDAFYNYLSKRDDSFRTGQRSWDDNLLDNYRELFYQLLFCRLVDNFLIYLADILALGYKAKPDILKSAAPSYSTEFILSHKNMNDLVAAIASEKINREARAGIKHLTEYFLRIGIKEDVVGKLKQLQEDIELRSAIVHTRGIHKTVFDSNKTIAAHLKELEAGHDKCIDFLNRIGPVAQAMDEEFKKKFNVQTVML